MVAARRAHRRRAPPCVRHRLLRQTRLGPRLLLRRMEKAAAARAARGATVRWATGVRRAMGGVRRVTSQRGRTAGTGPARRASTTTAGTTTRMASIASTGASTRARRRDVCVCVCVWCGDTSMVVLRACTQKENSCTHRAVAPAGRSHQVPKQARRFTRPARRGQPTQPKHKHAHITTTHPRPACAPALTAAGSRRRPASRGGAAGSRRTPRPPPRRAAPPSGPPRRAAPRGPRGAR